MRRALIAFFLLGCERIAPGPSECVRFTELATGYSHGDVQLNVSLQNAFDTLVTLCLTTPLHKAAIACAEQTGSPLTCVQRHDPRFWRENFAERRLRGPFE